MRAYAALLVLALFVGVGCKKGSPLVGTWSADSTVLNMPAHSDATFNADGTCTSVTKVQRPDGKGGFTATDKGTWTLTGDQLTEKVTDVDWQFFGGAPDKLAEANATFARQKPNIIAEANKNPTETIKWEGDDQYSYTRDGVTYTYRRKK